jgi:hypothetical protein
MTKSLYVIALDTRYSASSADIRGYEEKKCNSDYFQRQIVQNPQMICCKSKVAEACGLDIKLYFMKHKPGLGQYYLRGGEAAWLRALQEDSESFLANNNGAVLQHA